jgi:protoheme IX farnesyltransferase
MSTAAAPGLGGRLGTYASLVKSLQTGLLVVSGLAGYMSGRCPALTWPRLLALAASLTLAVGGSTVLNMVYDRDIDARMARTCRRPLPAGRIGVGEATALGVGLSALGVGWALALSPLYGAVVAAGLGLDVFVYTVWLKRRSPHAIVVGGLAGGMPILAGRALAVGRIDAVGLLLALAVVLWIPTHTVTYALRHAEDYDRAGVPTLPARYGARAARLLVTLSSAGAGLAMAAAAALIGLAWGYLRLLALLSLGLLGLAILGAARPSPRLNLGLYKYASLYMLGALLLLIVEGL